MVLEKKKELTQVQLSLEAHPQLEVQSQPPMMMMMKFLVVG